MSKHRFEVLVPLSLGHTMHQPGETIEATEEELEGFLQAGYVRPAGTKKQSSRSKAG